MPVKKSQHFVPRCYLVNFGTASEPTISLYNIGLDRIVHGAPIKSQCAKPYFYGNDELEDVLAEIEGKYADIITRGPVSNNMRDLDTVEEFARFFMIVQHLRTEAASLRMKAMFALTEQLADIPDDSEFSIKRLDLSPAALAREGVNMAVQAQPFVQDLRMVLLENTTSENFITCDDPAVFTNRLYLQRLKRSNFGFSNAGALFYLPVSPRLAIAFYDVDVYSPDKTSRYRVKIRKTADIKAFNHLVYLRARQNIYFRNAHGFDKTGFLTAKKNRVSEWHTGEILIPNGHNQQERMFRRVTDGEERPESGSYVIHTAQVHPTPQLWPSVFPFRKPAHAFSNGSEAGLIRGALIDINSMQGAERFIV